MGGRGLLWGYILYRIAGFFCFFLGGGVNVVLAVVE